MAYGTSYANLDSQEGSVNGTKTITFNWKPRKIIITNDSSSVDLGFQFNTVHTVATLKPTETISLEMASKTIVLTSSSAVSYRIWGIG